MVYQMSAYFRAGVITLLIFLAGLLFGVWLDNFRLAEIRQSFSQIEIETADASLLSQYFKTLGKDACAQALQQNLDFNHRIYQDGQRIEKAIAASGLTPELELEQKRYVLLQTTFWFNSLELKKQCNFNYSTVVYLFAQKDLPATEQVTNKLQSGILLDLKEKCGNKIMLVPLEADLNLAIVQAIMKQYNVQKLPAIIINTNQTFQGLTTFQKLNEVVQC